MENKKLIKRFGLADYLEEEKFLQEQHKHGWRMVDFKLPFCTYVFEKCEPQDYVYQLDFKQPENDEEQYLQLFADCDWEYFYKYNSWYYFRKLKSEIAEENTIFSDVLSRAEMAKKVVKFQAVVSLAVMVLPIYLIPLLLNRSGNRNDMLFILLVIFGMIVGIFVGTQLRNFFKLNKIIKREEQI